MDPVLIDVLGVLIVASLLLLARIAHLAEKRGSVFQDEAGYLTPAFVTALAAGTTIGFLFSWVLRIWKVEAEIGIVAWLAFTPVFIGTFVYLTRRGYLKARSREVATKDETVET